MLESPTGGDVLLDLLLTKAEELIGEIKTSGSLTYSGHVLLELMILRDTDKVKSVVRILNLRKVNFQFFKD